EWELPGGQIEIGETPAQCVAREIAEETRWLVTTGPLLDAWMYQVVPGHHMFVVVYGCCLHSGSDPVLSHEHKEIGLFTQHEVSELVMQEDYRRAVARWFDRLHHGALEKIS
ncbi:MAG: NUDIX domain-containing protein, partial [Pseudonocardiaceae bacterium]